MGGSPAPTRHQINRMHSAALKLWSWCALPVLRWLAFRAGPPAGRGRAGLRTGPSGSVLLVPGLLQSEDALRCGARSGPAGPGPARPRKAGWWFRRQAGGGAAAGPPDSRRPGPSRTVLTLLGRCVAVSALVGVCCLDVNEWLPGRLMAPRSSCSAGLGPFPFAPSSALACQAGSRPSASSPAGAAGCDKTLTPRGSGPALFRPPRWGLRRTTAATAPSRVPCLF